MALKIVIIYGLLQFSGWKSKQKEPKELHWLNLKHMEINSIKKIKLYLSMDLVACEHLHFFK